MAFAPVDGWIQTHTGQRFFYKDLKADAITLEDIAHATSNLCRFNGHTKTFYSVAQHAVMVSHIVEALEPVNAHAGLMHDAPEAYVGDCPKPFKDMIIDAWGPVETSIWELTASIWGMPQKMPESVKYADMQALLLEKRDLLAVDVDWGWVTDEIIEALPDITIEPVGPTEAKQMFLDRFVELGLERVL